MNNIKRQAKMMLRMFLTIWADYIYVFDWVIY